MLIDILLRVPHLTAGGLFDERESGVPPLAWNRYQPPPQTKNLVVLLEQIALGWNKIMC